MKKLISILLLTALIVSMSACASQTSVICEHQYEERVTRLASCAEEGSKVNTCSKCGDSYTTAIPKTGHSYIHATCTAPMKCTVCGETSGSALGHSFSSATCSAPATCSKCGQTSGSAKGHTLIKDAAVAATCISAGKTEGSHCSECGTVIVAQQKTSLTGHDYVSGKCKTCNVQINIQDASNTYLYYTGTRTLQFSDVVNGYFGFTCQAGHSTSGVNGMYNQKLVGYDSNGNQTFTAVVETYYYDFITVYIKYDRIPSTTTTIMISDFY